MGRICDWIPRPCIHVICEFARKVKKEEHIQLNKEQICDLLAVYLSMRSNESLYTVYKYDEDVHHMTMELLEDMEGELGKSLTGDRELVERLGAHLNLMFDRMHLGTMADCSDLGQLKQEYPQIYKIIEKNIDAFSKRHSLFISEGERRIYYYSYFGVPGGARRRKSEDSGGTPLYEWNRNQPDVGAACEEAFSAD